MAAVAATAAADPAATGLAVLTAAGAAVDVAEIAEEIVADAVVSRAEIAVEIVVDVGATVAHAETAVAAGLAGELVASTANADQAHHLDRFRT